MGFLVPCEEQGFNKCGVDRKSGIQALGVPVQVLIPSALKQQVGRYLVRSNMLLNYLLTSYLIK